MLIQYSDFVEKASVAQKEVFVKFSIAEDRLDTFLAEHIALQSPLAKLWKLVKVLLILSHGQASVERGFSVNRQVTVENFKERSFVAQRIIHDHITNIGGLSKLEISHQLLDAASHGRRRYMEYLDKQRKVQERAHTEKRKRKSSERQEELEKKRMRLTCEIASLQFDADKLATEAEDKAKLVLLTKSNALRNCAKEKQKTLRQVEEELAGLNNDK